jgi:hypothetical protein
MPPTALLADPMAIICMMQAINKLEESRTIISTTKTIKWWVELTATTFTTHQTANYGAWMATTYTTVQTK